MLFSKFREGTGVFGTRRLTPDRGRCTFGLRHDQHLRHASGGPVDTIHRVPARMMLVYRRVLVHEVAELVEKLALAARYPQPPALQPGAKPVHQSIRLRLAAALEHVDFHLRLLIEHIEKCLALAVTLDDRLRPVRKHGLTAQYRILALGLRP